MSFSYGGNPSVSDIDAVRFAIHDINAQAPLLQDAEVAWVILQATGVPASTPATLVGANLVLSASGCATVISRLLLQQADSQIGQLKITSTKRAEQYEEMAKSLRLKAQSYFSPYSGGQSLQEKRNFAADTDSTLPAFSRTEWDNPWTGSQNGFGIDAVDFGPPVQ